MGRHCGGIGLEMFHHFGETLVEGMYSHYDFCNLGIEVLHDACGKIGDFSSNFGLESSDFLADSFGQVSFYIGHDFFAKCFCGCHICGFSG